MEALKVLQEIAAERPRGEDAAFRDEILRLKRLALEGEDPKLRGNQAIERLFYFGASSIYRNDSRELEIRRMEMQRLETAFRQAKKQTDALHRMIQDDAWKEKATEEARTKIYRKQAGKDVPESWEELAVRIADVLGNVPAARP